MRNYAAKVQKNPCIEHKMKRKNPGTTKGFREFLYLFRRISNYFRTFAGMNKFVQIIKDLGPWYTLYAIAYFLWYVLLGTAVGTFIGLGIIKCIESIG